MRSLGGSPSIEDKMEEGKIKLTMDAWIEDGEWQFTLHGPLWLLDDFDFQMRKIAIENNTLPGLRFAGGPSLRSGQGKGQPSVMEFSILPLRLKGEGNDS